MMGSWSRPRRRCLWGLRRPAWPARSSKRGGPMAKDILVEVLDTSLLEHPAVIAWHKVAPDHGAPDRITKLKETRRSRGYRLHGAGPAGAPVIAKLGSAAGAAIEGTIYNDVLTTLPGTALRLYGLLEDREGHWLFLED